MNYLKGLGLEKGRYQNEMNYLKGLGLEKGRYQNEMNYLKGLGLEKERVRVRMYWSFFSFCADNIMRFIRYWIKSSSFSLSCDT